MNESSIVVSILVLNNDGTLNGGEKFFLATCIACGISLTKDGTCAIIVTCITAVAKLDP